MTRHTSEGNDLLDVLVDPQKLSALGAPGQSMVVRQARHAGPLRYLEVRFETDSLGGRLADDLHGARIHADFFDIQIAWETRCADRTMEGPVVLLKGAAYRALELGLSKGQLASDVDLLLPQEQLPAAEALLEADGWALHERDWVEAMRCMFLGLRTGLVRLAGFGRERKAYGSELPRIMSAEFWRDVHARPPRG